MKIRRLAAVTAAALLTVAAVAPVAAADVTVGTFVQEMARARSLDATDPGTAATALRTVGVALPADLDLSRPLTEGDVVRVARAIGIRVTSSAPDATFDRARMERFMSTFSAELAAFSSPLEDPVTNENPGQGDGPGTGESGPPFDPFSKGKGKGSSKAKGSVSPDSPD